MKKIQQLLYLSAAVLLLTGCAATSSPAPSAAETEPEEEYDQLHSDNLDDCTFFAFRTPEPADNADAWLTADRWVSVWNFQPETDYPEGSFLKITADVTILDGGEAGYAGEPEIRTLKDVQPVTYEEAFAQCDIPSGDTNYTETARKFVSAGSHYLVFRDQTVYRDGEKLGTFAESGENGHEILAPYYACPALLDYIRPDTLLSFEEHAEVMTSGTVQEPLDTDAVSYALYEIFEQPDLIIDADVMPLSAAQIAASRESGIYIIVIMPDGDCVTFGEDQIYYNWASVCSETTDGNLTVTFNGKRSCRLKPEAAAILLQACKPQAPA